MPETMDGHQLDETYYQIDFNLDHFIEQLPENLTSDYLLEYKRKLERLLAGVTSKVSELVLSYQPAYVSELERIADLQVSINESINVCGQGRRCLRFIKNGSTIIDHHQKREQLSKLLKSLTVINELKKSVMDIRISINNQEDLSRAIQMCKDGKAQLEAFDNYKCIHDMACELDELETCINNQALNFFKTFHTSSVEELRMFLENETWEMLPVRSDFKLVQLKEFSFLRNSSYSSSIITSTNQSNINNDPDYKEKLFQFDRVFLTNKDTSEDLFCSVPEYDLSQPQADIYRGHQDALTLERISLSSDSDINSELAKDYVDEDGDSSPRASAILEEPTTPKTSDLRLTKHSGPVLTNSSLNVLRLTGKYVQMMNVLNPLSFEILMKVYKLLDQYIAFVYKKFASNNDKQLHNVINSLRESLIGNDQTDIEEATSSFLANSNDDNSQQQTQTINEQSTIRTTTMTTTTTHVNSQKAVAVESLIFLVNQLWNLQEYLESLISADQRAQLREQFSRKSSMIPEFLKARADLRPGKEWQPAEGAPE